MTTVADIIEDQDDLSTWKFGNAFLCPEKWRSYTLKHTWSSVEFKPGASIPSSSGVYSLVIVPGIAGHPQCAYLSYIGKTVDLAKRYREYLSEKNNPKGRPKILRLLNKYDGYIWFTYTEVDENDIEDVEDALIDAYLPPSNDRYKGVLSKVKGAF